jgi:hypothetical protein
VEDHLSLAQEVAPRGIFGNLAILALRQVVEATCKSPGISVDVVGSRTRHFTDHSERLNDAFSGQRVNTLLESITPAVSSASEVLDMG